MNSIFSLLDSIGIDKAKDRLKILTERKKKKDDIKAQNESVKEKITFREKKNS